MTPLRALSLLPLLLAATAYSQTPAATPEPAPDSVATLKVSTRVVAISAVVNAKNGDPQGGLTKDDFLLKQDGKEQPIRYFSQGSDLPLTIALLVDTSGSQRTLISDETLASDVFFETMLTAPNDRAALIQFDARVLQLRGLTTSADQLHLALLSLRSDPQFAGATLLNDAIFTVASRVLAPETGRKAIVLLTDGGEAGSRTPINAAIEQAQRNNVQIYSILYTALEFPGGHRPPNLAAPHPGQDPGPAILQHLAEATGGRAFTVAPNLSLREIFARISADLRLQYELGYTPPATTLPNTYHNLDLKTREKKLSVQARKGFFAPP